MPDHFTDIGLQWKGVSAGQSIRGSHKGKKGDFSWCVWISVVISTDSDREAKQTICLCLLGGQVFGDQR